MDSLLAFNIPVENFQTGVPLPGATVTVYKTGTMTKASIYDLAGAARANPMTVDSTGLIQFKVKVGSIYDVQWSLGAYTSPRYVIDSGNALIAQLAVTPEMFGAAGDGVTDDRPAFDAACAFLGAKGGTIQLSNSAVYRIASSLTLASGCTIRGTLERPDLFTASSGASLATLPGIAIDAAATVFLSTSAAVTNCFIKRYGMAFPATDRSGFSGTAITFAGDSPVVRNVLAVGFHIGIAQTGTSISRYVIEGFYSDANYGCYINKPSYDTSVIRDVHLWPFSFQPSVVFANMVSVGIGIFLTGAQDNTVIDNVLAWGYRNNFYLTATGTIDIGTMWSDYPSSYTDANQIGLYIGPYTSNIVINNLQIWGGTRGLVQAANNTETVNISLCSIVITSGDAIQTTGGELYISSLKLQAIGGAGFNIGNNGSHVFARGYALNVAGALVNLPTSAMSNFIDIDLGIDPYFYPAGTVLFQRSAFGQYPVTAAASVSLPAQGREFAVNGTTQISTLVGGWGSREITLHFMSACPVSCSGNILLSLGDTTLAAGAWLRLRYDEVLSKWVELARWPSVAAAVPAGGWSFRNRLMNGGFDIWQRGTSFALAPLTEQYTADRWLCGNITGVTVTFAKVAAPAGFRGAQAINASATGVAAGSNIDFSQKIEARQIADLTGATCVLSFDCAASTSAGALSGQIYFLSNTAVDNGSFSVNDVNALPFTIPAGAGVAKVSLDAGNTANLAKGERIYIRFQQTGATGSPNISISTVQFESDRQISGNWNNPTPFEFRPLPLELAMCQRYYENSYNDGSAPGSTSNAGAFARTVDATTSYGSIQIPFKVKKRAAPTVTIYSPSTGASGKIRDLDGAADLTGSIDYVGHNAATAIVSNLSVSAGRTIAIHYEASAEL